MPGGRPPKPTALKLLQGNPGRRALPQNEPVPPAGAIELPRPLQGNALAVWQRLVPILQEMRVLSRADVEKLAMACEAEGDYLDLRARIKKVGRIYRTITVTGSTVYRPRPEVAMCSEAFRRADRILSEFGLSPSTRSKVQAIVEQDADPFDAFLKGKRASGDGDA